MPSLSNLVWLIAGAAIAWLVLRPWRRRGPAAATAGDEPATASSVASTNPPERPAARPPVEAQALALAMAQELADITSGVEGRAHHLIEAAPAREQLPAAAEALLSAIQRLRTLHGKLLAFGQRRAPGVGRCEAATIVRGLVRDLAEMQFGIELRLELPPRLPTLAVPGDTVRDTMLFLCAALLRTERGATHLSIAAEVAYAHEAPCVQLELALEWGSEHAATTLLDNPGFALDLEAANNLAADHGGEVTVFHLPGRSVRAVVTWPAATGDVEIVQALAAPTVAALPEPTTNPTTAAGHGYGGTILLETDPAIRAVLANELKATGRAVFACADGAAACSMLAATPDRFELLVVDHPQRLDVGDQLAQTIRALTPDLKIFVLGQEGAHGLAAWPRLHFLQKPFGVHELRHALATVLAAG
ncbi:MAG: hypothetical protein IT455_22070 [Planctomycetes bacterium]|nr:hypothetical protein [Planctomycetota bacterium]